MQDLTQPVFLPVIIGTPRQGRLTEPAANFVFGEVSKRGNIETELIDIRKIPLRIDDAGEALKDSQFSTTVARADGLILVVPEYNHSFPGLLKHVLDTNLKEYIHKAVGVCGVSAGPFGGARMIQSLLPVRVSLGWSRFSRMFISARQENFSIRLQARSPNRLTAAAWRNS
jgi:NAD(P)H-dependent FMN reductase